MRRLTGIQEKNGQQSVCPAFESRLLRVLGLMLVEAKKQTEQIALLSRAGYTPSEIAEVIGTTPHTVSATLYTQKNGKKPKWVKN
jgi:DNA-binding CsgD family transcriptional regulator